MDHGGVHTDRDSAAGDGPSVCDKLRIPNHDRRVRARVLRSLGRAAHIRSDGLSGRSGVRHFALTQEHGAFAQGGDAFQLVGDDDRGHVLFDHLFQTPVRPLLERKVADGEDLVDDEHLGLEVRRNREAETGVHAAGIATHRRVEELRNTRELDDLVELAIDLRLLHAHDRALEIDVLAPGQSG